MNQFVPHAYFQEKTESIRLLGRAWSNIVFMRGWDELMPSVESIVAEIEEEEEEGWERVMSSYSIFTINTEPGVITGLANIE